MSDSNRTQRIYVLQLENDRWYVGRTGDVTRRVAQHFAGEGSAWTKLHKPVALVSDKEMVGLFDEDNKVKSLMLHFGVDKVRGGSYCMIELPEYQLRSLKVEMDHVLDRCFKCGMAGHFAASCGVAGHFAATCDSACRAATNRHADVVEDELERRRVRDSILSERLLRPITQVVRYDSAGARDTGHDHP